MTAANSTPLLPPAIENLYCCIDNIPSQLGSFFPAMSETIEAKSDMIRLVSKIVLASAAAFTLYTIFANLGVVVANLFTVGVGFSVAAVFGKDSLDKLCNSASSACAIVNNTQSKVAVVGLALFVAYRSFATLPLLGGLYVGFTLFHIAATRVQKEAEGNDQQVRMPDTPQEL